MSTTKSKRPSIAPPRPSTFPPNRRCPIHGFALSPDGRCIRCGTEGRSTALRSSGVEPLLAPTPLRTKLVYVLIAVCGLGAVLVYAGRSSGAEEPVERGLVTPPGAEPQAPPPSEAENALAAARSENERRDREAAARRHAEEEEDRQRARAQVPVVLYGTTWCGVCTQARTYLRAHNIPFTDHDIEADAAARATYAGLNPANTVPTLTVGSHVLRGFSPMALEQALDAEAETRLR